MGFDINSGKIRDQGVFVFTVVRLLCLRERNE